MVSLKDKGKCKPCLSNCEACPNGWALTKSTKKCSRECKQNIEQKQRVSGQDYYECQEVERAFNVRWKSALQFDHEEKGTV